MNLEIRKFSVDVLCLWIIAYCWRIYIDVWSIHVLQFNNLILSNMLAREDALDPGEQLSPAIPIVNQKANENSEGKENGNTSHSDDPRSQTSSVTLGAKLVGWPTEIFSDRVAAQHNCQLSSNHQGFGPVESNVKVVSYNI